MILGTRADSNTSLNIQRTSVCAKLVKVPRVFLTRAIAACVEAAREEGITEITPEFVDRVRDKRGKDRGG